MVEFERKESYNIDDLIRIVELLRSPEGCPWDKEQTHKSIRQDFIEEVYEAIEAIDLEDTELLREELGDVLLQVVFHCQIERENKNFVFDDICDELCKKLIVRHPHVFGDLTVSDSGEVLKNWDSIKKKTKCQETYTDTLNAVAKSLPALMRRRKSAKGLCVQVWISEMRKKLLHALSQKPTSLKRQLQTAIKKILKKNLVICCFHA